MKNKYFKNIPNLETLYLEKKLFCYDCEPIIFVCIDENNERYFCICDDVIDGYSWIIVKIKKEFLIDILNDTKTILSPFQIPDTKIIIADYNLETGEYTYSLAEYKDINPDELPVEDQFLEQKELLNDYIDNLSTEVSYMRNIPYCSKDKDLVNIGLEDPCIPVFIDNTMEFCDNPYFSTLLLNHTPWDSENLTGVCPDTWQINTGFTSENNSTTKSDKLKYAA